MWVGVGVQNGPKLTDVIYEQPHIVGDKLPIFILKFIPLREGVQRNLYIKKSIFLLVGPGSHFHVWSIGPFRPKL